MQEANLLKGKKKPAYTLLMHCEGVQGGKVYTEESGRVLTEFVTTVATDTAVKKFGGSSLNFLNSMLTIASEIVLPADYTVEAWVYKTGYGTVSAAMFAGDGTTGGDCYPFLLDKGTGVALRQGYVGYSMPGATDVSQPGDLLLNTWQHLAAVREGTTYRIFVDGVKKIDFGGQAVPPLRLNRIGGALFGSAPRLRGNMDEIMVIDRALYSANFTPPTAPY